MKMNMFCKGKYVCLVVVVMLGLVAAGCGGKKQAQNANEYVVGTSFELTGATANYGKSALSGFQLAIDEINKAGGVNGKTIKLVQSDNKSEPSESGNAVTKLIHQDKVIAVVGPATSGCVNAAEPVATGNKIPLFAPCATAPNITVGPDGKVKPFVFRAAFIDPFQGKAMAAFALKTLKVKKMAIMFDSSSDYSKGLAEVFAQAFTAGGGQIVAKEAFLAKDIDFKASLTKIKAANPEALYAPGYYEEIAKIVKQARQLGFTKTLLGSNGWGSPKLLEIAGAQALNNCYFSSAFSADDKDPMLQNFLKNYQAVHKVAPDVFAMQGYNAGYILANALKTAGSTDGTKLAATLAATKDLPVASGKFTYDKDHNPVIGAYVLEMKDGRQTFKEKINL